jgi:hypothetical protein
MQLNDTAAVGTLGMSAAASACPPPPSPSPPSKSENSTRLKRECSARYAVVIGSTFLKSECDAYDRGSYALAAGTCVRRFDPPSAPCPTLQHLPLLPPCPCNAAADVIAALFTRVRNHEDVIIAPCFTQDSTSSLPLDLLDLSSLQLPPSVDRLLGDACDPE